MTESFKKTCCRCRLEFPATAEFFSRLRRNGIVGLTSQCKVCRSLMWKAAYEKNRPYYVKKSSDRVALLRKTDHDYAQSDRERSREAKRKLLLTKDGRDHHNALQRKWRYENPERFKALKHQQLEAKAYRAMVRYARRRKAIPSWADKNEIAKKYEEARRVSIVTGIPHEVDHVVPLAGVNVCGLHVEYNLDVIPADINRSKGNKLI